MVSSDTNGGFISTTTNVSGAFKRGNPVSNYNASVLTQANFTLYPLAFDANGSNATYTDNGKVMPLSISKQSYIIYK